MKKVASVVMAFLALLAFTGGSVFAVDHEAVTIGMMEQNDSGQMGTAMITVSEDGTSITVELDLSNGSDTPQPAHIHAGSCADLGDVAYPLNDVVDGKSVTVLTEDAATGMGTAEAGSYAINVHKSADEIEVYTSCGDIVASNVVGMPTTGEGNNMVSMLAFVALALVATGTGLSFARRKA